MRTVHVRFLCSHFNMHFSCCFDTWICGQSTDSVITSPRQSGEKTAVVSNKNSQSSEAPFTWRWGGCFFIMTSKNKGNEGTCNLVLLPAPLATRLHEVTALGITILNSLSSRTHKMLETASKQEGEPAVKTDDLKRSALFKYWMWQRSYKTARIYWGLVSHMVWPGSLLRRQQVNRTPVHEVSGGQI